MSHLEADDLYRNVPINDAQKTKLPVRAPDRTATNPSKAGGVKSEMHITCQFRQGRAMVYDLKSGERRFEVRIQASSTSEGEWGVAMVAKDGVERAALDAVGATRLLALEALEQGSGTMLGREDWVGIRKALTEVRAL